MAANFLRRARKAAFSATSACGKLVVGNGSRVCENYLRFS